MWGQEYLKVVKLEMLRVWLKVLRLDEVCEMDLVLRWGSGFL
jgi:hypothetical protein